MAQSRRMLVLRAVVEDYIRSQEPIGSSALTKKHDLGVSSATVRNDMAALEEEGYLIQPHTSAGRIPTEKGYRYFVDRLATVMPLTQAQRRAMTTFLSGSVSLQDTLQRAARLLAQITGQVAVVASPALSKATLRHIEIVPVGASVLLAVVITDTGRVVQHTLAVAHMPSEDALARFSAEINRRCASISLSAAAEQARAMAGATERLELRPLAEALASALDGMADDDMAGELYMAGTSKLAHQRTASDLAPLLDALEEQVVLMRLMSSLSEEASSGGIGVAIGSETHTPGLLHASIVTSGYGQSPAGPPSAPPRRESGEATPGESPGRGVDRAEPVAFVGSIGPTHMDYAVTIAAVRAVARYLTAIISQDGAGPDVA